MKALTLYKARDMGTPQRIAQIQDYLQTQADDRFINLIYGMIKAETEKENSENSEELLRTEMIRRAEASEQDIAAGRTISAKEFKLKLSDWKAKKRAGIK